jgi:hypothetical protein
VFYSFQGNVLISESTEEFPMLMNKFHNIESIFLLLQGENEED